MIAKLITISLAKPCPLVDKNMGDISEPGAFHCCETVTSGLKIGLSLNVSLLDFLRVMQFITLTLGYSILQK